jgi:predicted ribosomally synthesized peptide with nif11-like leader
MLKEFKARFESDETFRAKIADAKTEDELLKLAKAEGYNLELLSEDELDKVAGGAIPSEIKRQLYELLKKAGY